MSAPQIGSLPALPEWTKHDDLDGLVPSEIRVEVDAYGRACWNAGMNYALANAPKDALTEAAPELLAALEECVSRSYNPFEPNNQSDHYIRMNALLAKIKGAA